MLYRCKTLKRMPFKFFFGSGCGQGLNFKNQITVFMTHRVVLINYFGRRFYAFILVLLLAAGCSKKKKQGPPAAGGPNNKKGPVAAVDVYIVRASDMTEQLEMPGTLLATESTDIKSELSGRLVYLNISEGKWVTQGTVLARLYDGDLQAQLRKLQVQLKAAQINEERQAKLLKIESISRQDYDLSLLQVNTIKADMDIVRTSLARLAIRAPYSGRLGLKKISPGAYITPADVLTTLRKTDQLKLDFTIPDKYASMIKPGQEIAFADEASGRRYPARVMATESAISEENRYLQVRALVQGSNQGLIPGSFARVVMNTEPSVQTVKIPTQAILPQARGKRAILYRNGVAVFKDITTGNRDSSFAEVTYGLQAGDTVLVTGLMGTRPDAKIKINKIINP
jgi:membrane fusion protein, multidrug efflux system